MTQIPQELVDSLDGITVLDDPEGSHCHEVANLDEENRIEELPDLCRPIS
jgi:hypothetical protein